MSNPSPAAEAKRLGTTIAAMADATGQSRQTLQNWHHNKPLLFKIVAIGTASAATTQTEPAK